MNPNPPNPKDRDSNGARATNPNQPLQKSCWKGSDGSVEPQSQSGTSGRGTYEVHPVHTAGLPLPGRLRLQPAPWAQNDPETANMTDDLPRTDRKRHAPSPESILEMEHKKQRMLSKDEGALMQELPVIFESQRQMIASPSRKVDRLTLHLNPGDTGIDVEHHEQLQDEVKILQTRNKALEDENEKLLQKIVDKKKAHDVTISQYQDQVDRFVQFITAQVPQLRSIQTIAENVLQDMPITLGETQQTHKTSGIARDSLGAMSEISTNHGVSSGSLPHRSSLSLFRLPAKEPIRSTLSPSQAPSASSAPAIAPTLGQSSEQRQPKSHSQTLQVPAPTRVKNKRIPKRKTAEELQRDMALHLAASYRPKQKTNAEENLEGER
ncbi:MAG: hypothetical protein Q9198_008113, partial [Flavoplaca austrocitrina]